MVPPDRLDRRRVEGPPLTLRIGALLAALLLAGCAAFDFTEAECRGMDWQRRGYADGFGGNPQQDLRLANACGRFGVAVPHAEYLRGWQAGYDEWYRLMGSMSID